jgi:U3 small nucleolar RNA-associated protein 21
MMTQEALQSIALGRGRPGSPSCLLLRAHGALAAVALDDGTVCVVDLFGGAVVRSFECGTPAVDIAFSPEGRWLAAALRGGGLRIFDLPASRCVDFIVFNRAPLSLAFSPSTAFLLIAHAKSSSIQVWANKFLFDPSLSAPLLAPEPKEPVHVDELDDLHFEVEEKPSSSRKEATVDTDSGPKSDATKPLEPDLLTLSDVPPAKWQATLHLDLVKERNKPIEPPKPLPQAPFFLPTAHEGVTPRFAAPLSAEEKIVEELEDHGKRQSRALETVMPFQELLRKGDFDGALKFLKEQTPSGVHLAIEELGPAAQGDVGELDAGLKFFEHHLGKAHFADELQAFLSLFLQAHGEEITDNASLRKNCNKLAKMQHKIWSVLDTRCQKVRCFLGTLTHTVVRQPTRSHDSTAAAETLARCRGRWRSRGGAEQPQASPWPTSAEACKARGHSCRKRSFEGVARKR